MYGCPLYKYVILQLWATFNNTFSVDIRTKRNVFQKKSDQTRRCFQSITSSWSILVQEVLPFIEFLRLNNMDKTIIFCYSLQSGISTFSYRFWEWKTFKDFPLNLFLSKSIIYSEKFTTHSFRLCHDSIVVSTFSFHHRGAGSFPHRRTMELILHSSVL